MSMNEQERSELAGLVQRCGVADVLRFLADVCREEGVQSGYAIRKSECDMCATWCQEAAAVMNRED